MSNNRGGDIQHEIFNKILSIGYELESTSLCKLTLLDDPANVLLNTDTAGQDLERLYKQLEKKNRNDEEDDADDEDMLLRQELFNIDAYTTESLKSGSSKMKKESNSSFIIANDMAVTPIVKYLNKRCKESEQEIINDILEIEKDNEDRDESADIAAMEYKNQLYSFHTDSAKKYVLQFANSDKKDCGMIADVEWIFTYYQPNRSSNIILDTFINVIYNLATHLHKLTSQNGKLVLNLSSKSRHIVPDPLKRKLFNLPGTNLHYLQTHLIDEQQEIDDICIVPQMTFSCNITDMIPIVKGLIQDSLKIVDECHEIAVERITIIENLEKCIDELFENSPILQNQSDENVRSIKNYLFLILFKLYQYYNHYLQDEGVKAKAEKIMYLKDALFINSRHSNYALYVEIKKILSKNNTNTQVVQMIRQLILQPKIMNRYMLEEPDNVRKNAFSPQNVLEKTHKNYGDPHYSLLSYLQFFEEPEEMGSANEGEEVTIKSLEKKHDWLRYRNFDIYSTTMEIKNGVVLAELRSFPRLLALYLNGIADEELLKELTYGPCNRATNKFNSIGGRFSLSSLIQFVKLYEKSHTSGPIRVSIGSKLKTRRKHRSRRSTKKNKQTTTHTRSK